VKLELKNKRVLVLGLGETGLSVLHWLAKQDAVLSAADSRDYPPNMESLARSMPQLTIYTGKFKQEVLLDAELIVISPGVPLSDPAVQVAIQHGIPVVGDVELFAQYRPKNAKVIGITGSNGKTTVTTLVGEICKEAGLNTIVAGNIGLPVLDALQMGIPDIYVLELSSFQLETTSSLRLDAATVLNVCEDHMDRYTSVADYAAAKSRILACAKTAVLNRDDATTLAMRAKNPTSSNTITFGLNAAPTATDFGLINIEGMHFLASGQRKLCNTSDLKITGQHNVANALAAAALCSAVGVDKTAIIAALRNFKGLPHRVEWVASINNVDFYDDSKGTNVGATCAAIFGMTKHDAKSDIRQKVVLIAGGDGKGQDFTPLAAAVQANSRAVVLFGRDAPLIQAALSATNVPMYQAIDLPEAVNIAKNLATAGDAVLLSPACASFDMFKNYVHRAEVFIDAVRHLETENKKMATC
jgi:UDP-N-acetylmuramoylalanine--D-glutamate ligase